MSVEKNKYDFQDYYYIVNGNKYKRKEVIDMILDALEKNREMTMEEISEATGIPDKYMKRLVAVMRDHNLIQNTGKKRKDKFLYKTYYECLLAELFNLTPENIEKQFKVKGRIVRKVEDAQNISYARNNGVTYTGSIYDSPDWE